MMPQPKIHESHAQRQAAYHKRREEARRQQLAQKGLPALPALPTVPGIARWRQAFAVAYTLLETVAHEMQRYYDDRSDAWKESNRAELFQERIDALLEVCQALENLMTA